MTSGRSGAAHFDMLVFGSPEYGTRNGMAAGNIFCASLMLAALSAGAAEPSQPWTLHQAADLPEWLTVQGSIRTRYESLDGQYRVGRSRSDQLVNVRTTLLLEARRGSARAGVEVFDSRGYLADRGSSVGTGEVNVLEPVQAYVGFNLGDPERPVDLQLGRFTMTLGSGRLVGRNAFRNTTNAFTGAKLQWTGKDQRFTAFHTYPQQPRPADRDAILDNEREFDDEDPDLRFWGMFYERPSLPGGAAGELFLFGLRESDDAGQETRNRRLLTPGARLVRKPAAGAWDFELEAGWQFGEARATADPSDTRNLDVSAQYLHGDLGYTFDAPWQPRLGFRYDYASGEQDASDGKWQRFDPLYGPRRADFGPAGLYGALSRVNLSAPGIKLDVTPNSRWDGFVEYKAVWLAEGKDRMDRAGVADPSGVSGRFVGHQVQVRARYWLVPQWLRLELGGAALVHGRFLEDAPNAPGFGDTHYAYADVTWSF